MAPGTQRAGSRLDARATFDAVIDLASTDREAYYASHQVSSELRAEVESLLGFEVHARTFLANGIGSDSGRAAAAALLQQPQPSARQRCGPFELGKLLGQGGMGAVWLADRVDGEVDQIVAVKLLHSNLQLPKLHERFVQERQILASLSHPNISRLLDAGHTNSGQPYLVIEYVDGQPIDKYCEFLDLRRKLEIFLKVCDAVSHAHRNLIVHRDLKPSNILVTRDGEPKLLDFGIAKLITHDPQHTRTIERMLTPEYASPEQVTGENTGTATDIYSLGAILYKLATGQSPHQFDDGNPSGMAAAICDRDVTRPSKFNAALAGDVDSILLKALRKEPHERYPSVDKLAEDIEAHLQHRPVLARSGSMLYRGRRFLRRHWLAVAGPTVAILGLLAGLLVAHQQRLLAEQARNVAENQRHLAEGQRLEAQQQRDNAARERGTAIEQANAASREREEANRQRAVAEERFQEVRQLTLQLLDLDQNLAGLAGSTKVRQSLVTTALSYLEKLRSDTGAKDVAYRLDLAEAYRKVADVQAGPGHPNLAQIKESSENLEKAEKLLLESDANNPKILNKLVENLDLQTRIAASAQDWSIAEKRVDRGLHYLELLRAQNPKPMEPVMRFDASLSYSAQAIYVNLEQTRKAVEYGSRAARVRADLFRISKTPAAEINYAIAMMALATTLRYDGALKEALEQASAARKIFEKQYQATPQAAYGRRLNWALYYEGSLLGSADSVSLGQFQEAEPLFERALTISRPLVKADAEDIPSRNILASTVRQLGRIRLDRDPAAALALYDEGFKIRTEIPAANPAHGEKLDLLSDSIRALVRLGRQQEAKARLDQLFQLLRDGKHYPGPIRPGNFAANGLRARAEVDAAAGRVKEAIQTWTEMVSGFEANKERTKADLHWSLQFAEAYRALALLEDRLGDAASARSWREKDRALWSDWSRKLPGNVYVVHQLAVANGH